MDELLTRTEEKMEKTKAALLYDFSMIRAGRANPRLLDRLTVDYWGAPTPLQQVANISVPEARMIVIQPWDKTLVKAINKAILASDIGITPTDDGQVIRLVFPELTGERRQELVKEIRKKAEASKVAVRNIRRDAMEEIKKAEKASEITEDDEKDLEEKTQKLTDRFIKEIDEETAKKSTEITTV